MSARLTKLQHHGARCRVALPLRAARSEREQGQAHLAPQGTDPSLTREVGLGVKQSDSLALTVPSVEGVLLTVN